MMHLTGLAYCLLPIVHCLLVIQDVPGAQKVALPVNFCKDKSVNNTFPQAIRFCTTITVQKTSNNNLISNLYRFITFIVLNPLKYKLS
jgi:hypothetical protein